jgi:para-nitrobenzyl esterase
MKAGMVFSLFLSAMAMSAAASQDPVKVESGWLVGGGTGIHYYKGIPYAAPPVGDLRWRPPQAPIPWQGLRMAKEYGSACVQYPLFPGTQSEDCLSLNIWTPASGRNDKLPVMVWIHGGGFQAGAGSHTVSDGEEFAKQGVVLVSINYRLGILGFFAHPDLSRESSSHTSGNYGLLDQIAALQWIKKNIGEFGGNSENVTIFGVSAGASSVCLLAASPLAQGLFQRVIAESPYMFQPTRHLSQSWYGRASLEQIGSGVGESVSTLRKMTADEIFKKSLSVKAGDNLPEEEPVFMPIVDGWVLPDDPSQLFESGKFANVPFIVGTNRDEGSMLLGFSSSNVNTLSDYHSYLLKYFGSSSGEVEKLYPAINDAGAHRQAVVVAGDVTFLKGARKVIAAVSKRNEHAYLYLFSRVSGGDRVLHWGAFHGTEIPYVFDNLPDSDEHLFLPKFALDSDTYNEKDYEVARTMNAAWVRFARSGDPNGGTLLTWPSYRTDHESYMEFGDAFTVKTNPRAKQLDYLADRFRRLRAENPPAITK